MLIIVFDYIRADVAKLILKSQVEKIIRNLATEKKITLEVSDIAMNKLLKESLLNLSNGARGIGNIVESMLLNPLSRYLFDNNISEEETLVLLNISQKNNTFEINLKKQGEC